MNKNFTVSKPGSNWRSPDSVFLLILVVCYVAVMVWRMPSGVAGDELWSVAHANLSVLDSLVFTLRFDLHPPVYYLQLLPWSLVGKSDLWLKLNSAFWVVFAAVLIHYALSVRVGRLAALLAVGLFISNPLTAKYATEVRMYAMIASIAVIGLLVVSRCVRDSKRSDYIALFVVSIIEIYIHVAGFLIVISQFFYGVLLISSSGSYRKVGAWFGLHVLLGMFTLPVGVLAMFKSVAHTQVPSLAEMGGLFSSLAGNQASKGGPHIYLMVSVFYAMVFGLCVKSKETARIIVSYLVVPVLLCFAVSHLVKPLWIVRAFYYSVPVVAFGVAVGIAGLSPKVRAVFSVFCVAVTIGFAVTSYDAVARDRYRSYVNVAEYIKSNHEKNDCYIISNELDGFWAVARYLNGPYWGSPLDIQAVPNDRWTKLFDKLPMAVVEFLDLRPEFSYISGPGAVKVFAGTGGFVPDLCPGSTRVVLEAPLLDDESAQILVPGTDDIYLQYVKL